MSETSSPKSSTTTAFNTQAAASFAIALGALVVAIAFLPADAWIRAFLALGVLYLTTSAFTLAKCVRDRQEASSVLGRIDQARLERLLSEHDPFRGSVS